MVTKRSVRRSAAIVRTMSSRPTMRASAGGNVRDCAALMECTQLAIAQVLPLACRRVFVRIDRRDETIALTGHVFDVTGAAFSIAERLAQSGHVDPEIAGADHEAAPHACDQIPVTDDLTCAFDQHDQNVQARDPPMRAEHHLVSISALAGDSRNGPNDAIPLSEPIMAKGPMREEERGASEYSY